MRKRKVATWLVVLMLGQSLAAAGALLRHGAAGAEIALASASAASSDRNLPHHVGARKALSAGAARIIANLWSKADRIDYQGFRRDGTRVIAQFGARKPFSAVIELVPRPHLVGLRGSFPPSLSDVAADSPIAVSPSERGLLLVDEDVRLVPYATEGEAGIQVEFDHFWQGPTPPETTLGDVCDVAVYDAQGRPVEETRIYIEAPLVDAARDGMTIVEMYTAEEIGDEVVQMLIGGSPSVTCETWSDPGLVVLNSTPTITQGAPASEHTPIGDTDSADPSQSVWLNATLEWQGEWFPVMSSCVGEVTDRSGHVLASATAVISQRPEEPATFDLGAIAVKADVTGDIRNAANGWFDCEVIHPELELP